MSNNINNIFSVGHSKDPEVLFSVDGEHAAPKMSLVPGSTADRGATSPALNSEGSTKEPVVNVAAPEPSVEANHRKATRSLGASVKGKSPHT